MATIAAKIATTSRSFAFGTRFQEEALRGRHLPRRATDAPPDRAWKRWRYRRIPGGSTCHRQPVGHGTGGRRARVSPFYPLTGTTSSRQVAAINRHARALRAVPGDRPASRQPELDWGICVECWT
jgi:hypothetical protein